MSTYSLSLRQPLGRKLTTQELDNNFLYLQNLALSATGGSASIGSEFEQTNTTTGFKLINKSEVFDQNIFGTNSLAGSYFTNGTSSWFSGLWYLSHLGGDVRTGLAYTNRSGNFFGVITDGTALELSAINYLANNGSGLTMGTQGSSLSYTDFNDNIQNQVIVGDIQTGILNFIATQSKITFGSIIDPNSSPITQDFVTIDGVGNFESFNPNSGFSIGNIYGDADLIGVTASFVGVWDNSTTFQGIGLFSISEKRNGVTYSSIINRYSGKDEQEIRIVPGIGIQIISDMGGTNSFIYVNEGKVDLSYDGSNSRIELDTSGVHLNTAQELKINGATAWSGTYSTGDGRVTTVTKGIITDVS